MISLTSAPVKKKVPGQKSEPGIVKKTEKDLEEFRRSGAPPQVFSDDGRELNPYIPHYISAVPWFYKTDQPTLRQHSDPVKSRPKLSEIDETYLRGVPIGEIPVKFKAGSCENCGSSSHKKKDCMERPRKIGAKYTNKDLKPADYTQPSLRLGYDGKRDKWAGYDPKEYEKVIQQYDMIERKKQEMKSKKLEQDIINGTSSSISLKAVRFCSNDSDDDEKYADASSMPGTKYDIKQRTTVRNLRIREDTAKYLYNLDANSSFYDPKSRSMRENPLKDSIKGQNIKFKGDNENRYGGEFDLVGEATKFTLDAFSKGIDVHLLTDPTKAELLMRQFNSRKEALQADHRVDLLSKYGGEEHAHAPPKEFILEQSEEYVEYSRTGKIIKGQEKAPIKSKYTENAHTNNHTSVWGSYWIDFKWGYSCCGSTLKNSYCVGIVSVDEDISLDDIGMHPTISSTNISKRKNPSEETIESSAKKRKNKYNVIHDVAFPTNDEMESYMKNRKREGDPVNSTN